MTTVVFQLSRSRVKHSKSENRGAEAPESNYRRLPIAKYTRMTLLMAAGVEAQIKDICSFFRSDIQNYFNIPF